MSKYIIDLRPDCKIVQQICVSDDNVGVGARSVELFDALTDDYVKENFKDLLEGEYQRGLEEGKKAFDLLDAERNSEYQRGFEDGKKEAESSEAIEQVKKDAFNKGMLFKEEKIHDAFLRGVEKGKAVNDKGCEGCKLQGTDSNICDQCCNSYANQWKSKDDKIEVGDEVNLLGDCFIVTRIFQPRNMKEQCDGIDDDGCVYSNVLIDDLEKTGRHFDIASILEDMRND